MADPIGTMRQRMLNARCACPNGPEECLGEDELVTQFVPGPDQEFRGGPDPANQVGVSVQRGELTPEQCWRAMGYTSRPKKGSRVRHTLVGTLRDNGFGLIHTSRRIVNGLHVSVLWPAEAPITGSETPWPPEVTTTFNECFYENESLGGDPI